MKRKDAGGLGEVWFCLMTLLVAFFTGSCASFPRASMVAFAAPAKTDFENGSLQLYQSKSPSRAARPVVFVHGTPGEAEHWVRYLKDPELAARFTLITYDRPGFGGSTAGFQNLDTQVKALRAILDQLDQPAILVGHSLGGAIVLGAAARYPEMVHSVVALAPSANTTSGYVLRVNRFLRYTGMGWFLFPPWRVSHLEVLATYPFLRELQPQLAKITAPVTIVQGTDDRLISATSVPYLKKNLTATKPRAIILENEGHLIPWKQFDLVKKVLLARP
jgi:pimeloyl-ACP methyl ester carboxylesterase